MKLKLFYTPFSCSLATHIAIEESGLDYQRSLVKLSGEQHYQTDYIKLNPKGSVPCLLVGDQVLTENQAILTWIADQVPDKHLLAPVGNMQRYRAHELMNYCAASVHVYVRAIFRPAAYAYSDANADEESKVQTAIQGKGDLNLSRASLIIENYLNNNRLNWSVGERFSVVDAYLFIMYLWTQDTRVPTPINDIPKWAALAQRIYQRPAVKKIVEIELADRQDYQLPNNLL